jgi:probable HAF family extracellular repeat protein
MLNAGGIIMHKTVFLFFCLSMAGWLSASSYTITDLSTQPGGNVPIVSGINASGEVAATNTSGCCGFAALYNGSSWVNLGAPTGGLSSLASAINDAGQVTGSWQPAGASLLTAFLYDGTSMLDLGTLGGQGSEGNGINASGEVTGYAGSVNGSHAFLYNGTSMMDLGTLGGSASAGYGINNSGEVTGYSELSPGVDRAFLYNGTYMMNLGTLGGSSSVGTSINASGEVAGWSTTSGDATTYAFIYSNGAMTSLGTLAGGSYSRANAINDSGAIVGDTDVGAFLSNGVSMINLSNFIPAGSGFVSLDSAVGINDAGQIVGFGTTTGGQTDAFLLTPTSDSSTVPEPATLLLLGSGLLGIARRLGRRR